MNNDLTLLTAFVLGMIANEVGHHLWILRMKVEADLRRLLRSEVHEDRLIPMRKEAGRVLP